MKQTLVRALLSLTKLTQGFEVGLAICSPLAYVGASALAALSRSMGPLDPPASPVPVPQPAQERREIVSILANMARASVAAPPAIKSKETDDESK